MTALVGSLSSRENGDHVGGHGLSRDLAVGEISAVSAAFGRFG
jgi:hypothetical protein